MADYANAPDQRNPAEAGEDDGSVDAPMCMAELAAVLLGVLGALILISGLGFFTVHPPGQEELCRVKTLGLQNKTKDDQDVAVGACNALYLGVFDLLYAISIPFILCGLLAMVSAYTVGRAVLARDPESTPSFFKYGICTHIGGLVMVFIPSMIFPTVAGVVAAGLAPIHAYFITIIVGHAAVSLSGAATKTDEDPAVRKAAEAYETLYAGYCAASRTELCLAVGSVCMMVLLWVYIVDILRALASLTCKPPDYNRQGCQLCRAHQLFRSKSDQLYNTVGAQQTPP